MEDPSNEYGAHSRTISVDESIRSEDISEAVLMQSPGLTPVSFGCAPRAWPTEAEAPAVPPPQRHLEISLSAQRNAPAISSPLRQQRAHVPSSCSSRGARPTSPTNNTRLSLIGDEATPRGWTPSHLEKLRAAGLELRTLRTGGGYRERPYTASELLGVAASLGNEVRRLRGVIDSEREVQRADEENSDVLADQLRSMISERDAMLEQRLRDEQSLAEMNAELEHLRALEPAMAKLIVEQEATQFAKAEAEAELSSLRGEGARGLERSKQLELALEAEKEHAKILERRLEAQREATIRLVSVLPPPPLLDDDAADELASPTVHLLAHNAGTPPAPAAAANGSVKGGAPSASVVLRGASAIMSPGTERATQPGALSYLAECTSRGKAWVAYAESCYKSLLRERDAARALRSKAGHLETQVGESQEALRLSADEIADLKLDLFEARNEIRTTREARASQALEPSSQAQSVGPPGASPVNRRPPATRVDLTSAATSLETELVPSPKSPRRSDVAWHMPGGISAHHSEMKGRALAAEASRRYEELLTELGDERRARADEEEATAHRLAANAAEIARLRKECAALRRVAEAAMEAERRAVIPRRRSSVPSVRSPESAAGPAHAPSPGLDLTSLDGDGGGGRASLPKATARPASNGQTTFEMRRDLRQRAYERLKAGQVRAAAG